MNPRPLSPHLEVYRFFPGMALSILHRITGVWLSLGLLAFTYWLMSAGAGEYEYERAIALLGSWPAKGLLLAWLAAWCYHFVSGIRHLCWDALIGIEKAQARRSRTVVIAVTALAWLALAWLLFCKRGFAP